MNYPTGKRPDKEFPQPFHYILEGLNFYFRPIQPMDKNLLQQGFSELSRKSKYYRFFTIHPELSDDSLKFFTEIDSVNHVAWGIQDESGNPPHPVGVGRFVRLKDEPDKAEMAITVIDSFQGIGLGRILLAILNIEAAHTGIRKFRNHVLAENVFVMDVLNNLGIVSREYDGPITIVETLVYPDHQSVSNDPEKHHFKEIMKQIEEKMKGSLR